LQALSTTQSAFSTSLAVRRPSWAFRQRERKR
jgi:hypothetical protein